MGYFINHELPIILSIGLTMAIYGVAIHYVIQKAINARYNATLKIVYGFVAIALILMALYSFSTGVKMLF